MEDAGIYAAPEDGHLPPTSEDGYSQRDGIGDREHNLELALLGAEWMLTFRFTYSVHFPPHTIPGQYDFRSQGADLASPSNHHLHDDGLIAHPELLRFYAYAGDGHLLRRAADHQMCWLQFIARRDQDFGARRGMMSEQWMNTDWPQARGSLLALAHSWCAGLVLHAADDTAGFGDVVVELDRAEAVALGAVGLEALPLAGGLPPRLHNPWPRGSSPLKPGQRREVLVTDAGRAVTRPALDTLRPRAPVPGPGRPAPSPRPAERPRPDRTAACH